MSTEILKLITAKNNNYFKDRRLEASSSIPTTGTYNTGDIIINTNPINGIYGWICSEAGTPGLWVTIPTAEHVHNYASSNSVGGAATSTIKLTTARDIKIGNTAKSFDGSTNVSWAASEIGSVGADTHDHSSIIANYNATENASTIPTTLADGEVRFDSRVMKTTADLFPYTNNANAIISINKHTGAYNSQLGFSSDGNIYYRNTSATGTAWNMIDFGGDTCIDVSKTNLNNLTTNGVYHGSGLTNSPDGTSNQFYIEVLCKDSTRQHVYQRVTKLNSTLQEIYDRFMRSGVWHPWRCLKIGAGIPTWLGAAEQRTTDIPDTGRYYHASAADYKNIYVIGGSGRNSTFTNTNYCYSTTGNSWSTKTACPTSFRKGSADSYNGKIYVACGEVSSTPSNKFYLYDPSANTWTAKANLKTALKSGTLSSTYSGLVFIGGDNSSGAAVKTVYLYNPSTNTWTTKTNMTAVKRNHCAVSAFNKVYCIGGSTTSTSTSVNTNYCYDVSVNTWSTKAACPVKVSNAYACNYDGKIWYACGSEESEPFNDSYDTNQNLYIYDPDANTWTNKGSLDNKYGGTAECVDNIVYMIGSYFDYSSTAMTMIAYKIE